MLSDKRKEEMSKSFLQGRDDIISLMQTLLIGNVKLPVRSSNADPDLVARAELMQKLSDAVKKMSPSGDKIEIEDAGELSDENQNVLFRAAGRHIYRHRFDLAVRQIWPEYSERPQAAHVARVWQALGITSALLGEPTMSQGKLHLANMQYITDQCMRSPVTGTPDARLN